MLMLDQPIAAARFAKLPRSFRQKVAFFHHWRTPEGWYTWTTAARMQFARDAIRKNSPVLNKPAEICAPDASWIWLGPYNFAQDLQPGDLDRLPLNVVRQRIRPAWPKYNTKSSVRYLWEGLFGELSPKLRLIAVRYEGRRLVAECDINIYRYIPGMRDITGYYMDKGSYLEILGVSNEVELDDPTEQMEKKVRQFLIDNAPVGYDENDNEYRDYEGFFSLEMSTLVSIVSSLGICEDRKLIERVVMALRGDPIGD